MKNYPACKELMVIVYNVLAATLINPNHARILFNLGTCLPDLQIRVCIGNLFSLFLIQNIRCGYSKEPSQ